MVVSRRSFLYGTTALTLSAGLFGCSLSTEKESADSPQATTTPQGWDSQPRELPIPPLAKAERQGDRFVFKLEAQVGQSEILPGTKTKTWGFNGPMLGPTIRASRGQKVALEFKNSLPDLTAVHCHGMLIPAKMDGGPHSPIQPGETWTASFTVEQPAATLWYHPHPHGETGVQAYRGLAGMIILDDDIEDGLDLPRDYGVDDIPVVIMDANFTPDGQLDETMDDNLGLQGKVPHVNGITNPQLKATTSRIRLRLLNGSNMRFHNLGFGQERTFYHIASDSGLLDKARKVTNVMLGPGERAEILVELTPGEPLVLTSMGFADNLGVPEDESALDFGLRDVFPLLTIEPPATATAASTIPSTLDQSAAAPVDTSKSKERDFELNTFEINGQSMDMKRVDVVIDHSEPEIWNVTNGNSDWIHNFHIHNCAFKVLESSATDIKFDTLGWKDTVTIPPGVTLKLGVVFGQYRDNHYPYMYHCHMLYHEDQGMMGQFMMVNKGEKPELDTAYTQIGGEGHHH